MGAGLYSVLWKKAVQRYSPWTVVTYALGFGSFFLLIARGVKPLYSVNDPTITWIWIFALAIFSTLLGYSIYTRGLKYIEASRAGIVATWEVVVASFLAFIIFGESLSTLQIFGALFIFLGIFIIRAHPQKRKL